ncbi:MAG TPA: flagellar hook-associated protein FlgL [Azonexus sp.]|nr:flagellar hook-associated protein FlgL [Azonexus sp.]
MRISTSMIFNSGTAGMQARQSDLYKVQQQLSTGRRVLSPQDDPIAASEALQVSQSKAVNKQYLDNQATAKSELGLLDTVLGSVVDELQSIREKAVQAGNASYSPAQRGMIADELKQRRDSLLALANTQDASGLYVFSGFQSTTQPFQLNGARAYPYAAGGQSYATYQGDSGQQNLQVTASQVMSSSENGMDVFMQVKDSGGNVVGRSIFDSLQNMIDILDPASGVPFSQATYTQALGDMAADIDHVSTVRSSVGSRMQSLTSMTTAGDDTAYQYDVRLSALQDLDYTEAISRFSNFQMQLDAAQLSFKQTSQLSLFNIL